VLGGGWGQGDGIVRRHAAERGHFFQAHDLQPAAFELGPERFHGGRRRLLHVVAAVNDGLEAWAGGFQGRHLRACANPTAQMWESAFKREEAHGGESTEVEYTGC